MHMVNMRRYIQQGFGPGKNESLAGKEWVHHGLQEEEMCLGRIRSALSTHRG